MRYSEINRLSVSWATSRGRDTYGYNICRLDDRNNRKRYRTCGGGYDMVGTVFGQWLADTQQPALRLLAARTGENWHVDTHTRQKSESPEKLYGLTGYYENGELVRMVLDGGCGIESMLRIAEAIGFECQREYDKKGRTTDWIVARIAAE